MTEKEQIFSNLETVARAVVGLFGRNCEACVHDLTSLQNSLVFIAGDVTGRREGAPATDLLVKLLREDRKNPGELHNYRTTTGDGRSLKSTTTFVKGSDGEVVAAFCINFDTTDFYNACQALSPFFSIEEQGSRQSVETFAQSAGETIDALFEQAVGEVGKHPATMNLEEKIDLVMLLEKNGIFQLKGAVEQVAEKMGVTKYTVYNYLKRIRN
jgi:predicted transcriptional regulator YheO